MTVVDLIILIAVGAAAIIATRGGDRFRLGTFRVSARDPWRAAAWAAGLAVARWILWRRIQILPAFNDALRARWRALVQALLRRMSTAGKRVREWQRPWLERFRGSAFRRRTDKERTEFGTSTVSARHAASYVCVLLVLCLAPLWPQLTNIRAAPDPGDPFFSAWRLAWVAHQLVHAPGRLFDANIFYPTPLTLTYSDSMLLPGIVVAPLIWAGLDPLIVSNLLFVAAFPLAAVAFFFAARRLTGDLQASFVAGLLGGLCPFHFEHYSHLELQFFFWVPLALVATIQILRAPRISTGILLGVLLMGQCLTSMYFGGMLLTYLIPFTLVVAIGWRIRPDRQLFRALGAAAIMTAVALVVLGIPYLQSRHTRGERSPGDVLIYSAVPDDYLESNYHSPLYRNLLHSDPHPERQLFPGATSLMFAAAALSPHMPVPAIAALVAGVFAFDWSLGTNGLTYEALYRWVGPYRSMRVPARFAVFVATSLILLAAYGVRRLLGTRRSRRARSLLFAALVLGVLVDLWPSVPLREYLSPMPPVYRAGSSDMVLAEFPMRDEANIAYMYFSTTHWAKLLNGYSGYLPEHYVWLESQMGTFPSASALNILQQEGATHITVNCAFYQRPSECLAVLQALDHDDHLQLVTAGKWQGVEVRLYRITRDGT